MADVFISSSHAEHAAAEACAAYLNGAGFEVWRPAPDVDETTIADAEHAALAEARAILVIWSPTSILQPGVLSAASDAAATGRLIATRSADLNPRLIPSEFRSFVSIPITDLARIAQSLLALGVEPRTRRTNGTTGAPPPRAEQEQLERQAWNFVERRGDVGLIRRFLDRFPRSVVAGRAQQQIEEIEGTETPDENERRPYLMMAGIGFAVVLLGLLGLSQLTDRKPVEIRIATGDEDGAYKSLVDGYNDYLKQYGVKLVTHEEANGGFKNVQLLADGKVDAAFIKGGFAGALNDQDYLNADRLARFGKDWDRDWRTKIKSFGSLGRVMLEPLWVFTFGASESNKLNELDGEPINVGTATGGTRTLASLLLEANKVRFKPGMWLDTPLPLPKAGDPKPIGLARAYFLQRHAESPRVRAFLQNLAAEASFDKTRDVRVAVFSPNGKTIALALGDNTARIWDAATGHEAVVFKGHEDLVNDVAFSPDGTRLATGSDDGTVKIWDVATGRELKTFTGSGEDINGVAFSPDGKRVVSASESDHATVREVETGKVLVQLTGHEDDLTAAVFSPDGRKVVTSSRDGTARIWDAQTGAVLHTLRGHTKTVQAASFSADGKLVATASWDNTARIWEVDTGDLEMILTGHEDLVRGVEFSPDGKLVITASWDDSARIWEVGTGRQIRRINGLRSNVNGVGFSPDGNTAMTASQDGVIRLWSTKTWEKTLDFTTREDHAAGHVARNLHLMSFEKEADAYISRFPFLSKVVLPRGAVQFEPHAPTEPVTLLATSVAVVVDKAWADSHRSLARVLTEAIVHRPLQGIDEATGKPRLFFQSAQFPTLADPEYDAFTLGAPIYRSGEVPFLLSRVARLSRYIPFNVAAWIDEHAGTVFLSLIPVLGILYPLIRAIPIVYNWIVRRRILYWYRRLHVLEARLDQEDRAANPNLSSPEIEKIDAAVAKIKVPLNFSNQYYDLRAHIELVRQRLAGRQSGPDVST